jgi:hypothetical protein
VDKDKIVLHPLNEVVLEASFDNLVEEVGSDKLVHICTRKRVGKWLEIGRKWWGGLKSKTRTITSETMP